MSIYLDLFGDDYRSIDRFRETERREGPCEDDCESTAPFIGIMPEESDSEDASPLNFSHDRSREWEQFCNDYERILQEGLP